MTRRLFLRLALAGVILFLLLIQPNHPAAMTWGALRVVPLELPVILFGLMALPPGRISLIIRGCLVAAIMVIAVLKLADFGMFTAFARGFNPVADLPLIEAGIRLLTGSIGPVLTVASVLGAVLGIALVTALLWWATGVWAAVSLPRGLSRGAAFVATLAAGIATAEIGQAMGRWSLPLDPPGAAFTARVGVERVHMVIKTAAELRAFRIAATEDPYADAEGLFSALDREMLVIFVESYGRTSLDTPFYAGMHRATLAESEKRLGDLGLAMASGVLSAPTKGGQSWLSHATFMNGLWINDQIRYGAALASGRETLFHIAARSGFRTAAVMPQITLEWPEADFMGFDTVLAAQDLGYRGLPFNWVTMPDQFTLAALDRLVRDGPADARRATQVALASSHAPWVPVPDLVPWDEIGDGRIFDPMALSGDPPEVVWRNHDRVRAQYRLSIDYSLRTVFDYVALHAEDPPLFLIIGDHQAAGFIALDDRPDVPIHVIGPAHLVAQAAAWAAQPGLLPGPETPVVPMDQMRNLIIDAFSDAAQPGGAG